MKHTLYDRINGINHNCSLTKEEIKKCYGYVMIGDRACDSRHVYGNKCNIRICKYHK
jgi:hypothetical protein